MRLLNFHNAFLACYQARSVSSDSKSQGSSPFSFAGIYTQPGSLSL